MCVFESELIDVRRVGRPRKRWIDSVGEILGYRSVTVEQTERSLRQKCRGVFVIGHAYGGFFA